MSLDIKPLRVLDSIMATGSVTDAAVMLRRTQPQISRILKMLEDDLGFALFQRQGRRMVPTTRGRLFHAHARRLLSEAEALSRVAESVRMSREHTIAVAAPAYAAHLLVPSAVATMAARYADLDFQVITIRRQADGQWDNDVTFDIGVVAMPFERPGLTAVPLAQIEFVALLPAQHRLAAKQTLQFEDFAGENFIAVNWESQMRRSLDPFFSRMQSELHIKVTTNTTATACQLISQGMGVGIGDPLVAAAYVDHGLVMRRFAPAIQYTLGAVHAADTAPSAAIREFMAVTLATARQLAPELVSDI